MSREDGCLDKRPLPDLSRDTSPKPGPVLDRKIESHGHNRHKMSACLAAADLNWPSRCVVSISSGDTL